jgi:hypothetical protein
MTQKTFGKRYIGRTGLNENILPKKISKTIAQPSARYNQAVGKKAEEEDAVLTLNKMMLASINLIQNPPSHRRLLCLEHKIATSVVN